MARESAYQAKLVAKLKNMFPDCFITRSDPAQNQGVPDILILFGDKWAMLEVKRSASEQVQPNQEYYVDKFNGWSFAAFIYPENEERVLNDLQSTFGYSRQTRVS